MLKNGRRTGGINMKKKIALFLVAAMTVATFAACGAKDTPASAPKEESTSEGEDTP